MSNPTYYIKISKKSPDGDPHPSSIERRYTDFLELFTQLKQLFPDIFSNFAFPKKAVIGNFSPGMISNRSISFQHLLYCLVEYEKCRESFPVIKFLYWQEQAQILKLIQEESFDQAVVLIENSFQLLNKILTNRHPEILRLLCLLVACGVAARDTRTSQFALTAVNRFEGVSDTDSLRYYVPLLQLSVTILPELQLLTDRLSCMKRRGMKVDGCPSLLAAVLADMPQPSS